MTRYLLASTPLRGHVGPVLAVASELAARSHHVTVLTGRRFEAAVRAAGASYRALPAGADWDDRTLDRPTGIRRLGPFGRINSDMDRLLAAPLPHQHRALDTAVAELRPAAVLVDSSFLGGVAWRLHRGRPEPPLAVLNVTYLTVAGRGVPPPGPALPPMAGEAGERRDAAVRALTDRVLVRWGLARLDRAAIVAVGRPVPGLLFDAAARTDRLYVLTVPSFEYPREDLPATVRFVGPVGAAPGERTELPDWWDSLPAGRPVVHVTQGTMANGDLRRLLVPTVQALAGDPVTVVATTGGRPDPFPAGRRPANARVEPFIPYEVLLPRVDVMVTNGGFGGVQRALAAGVPLVVAGAGEDKPEVAARVARSGAGIALRTGRPGPARVGRAVRRVLADPSFAERARALAGEMAAYRGAADVADDLAELVAHYASGPGLGEGVGQ